jgi:hypothetical protein
MPMIVNGFPFKYVTRPSVPGSALKCRHRQRREPERARYPGGQPHRAQSQIVMIARQPDVKHWHLRIELLRERARGVGDGADVGRRCRLQDDGHGRVGATLIRRHGQGHGLRHASELREGQAARRVERNALTLEFLCGFGDVRVDFGAQLAVTPSAAAEETEQAREEDSQGGHDRSS